jgi:hypothetical protein
MKVSRLGVPLGARLEMITRHTSGTGTVYWRVWTGIRNKQVSPDKYQGHYIELSPDGRAVTGGNDEEVEVMNAAAAEA